MTKPKPEMLSELPLFGGVPASGLARFAETAPVKHIERLVSLP